MAQNIKLYTERKMVEQGIDPGMQPLVKLVCNEHEYETLYSCAGHAPEVQEHYDGNRCIGTTLNPNTAYISFKKGTGDGWLEKNARKLGFTKSIDSTLIDSETGKRVPAVSLYAGNPTAEHLSNKQAETYRRMAA